MGGMRRPLAIFAAAMLGLSACAPSGPKAPEPTPNVGVQLFQYNWNSVAKQCTDVLGPNNFAFVLLSPAQEHIQGEEWWTSYQPVSYQLESKLGTEEEFATMVKTCKDAGVDVIADAVINHMAGIDGGVGVAGTEFSHHEYPGLYGPDDFHNCGLTQSNDIENYGDKDQIQNCELSNLADLATEKPNVRETIVDFLKGMQELGVEGFRIDASKHMPAEDVEAIVTQLDGNPVIISEVIRAGGEPVQPEEYLDFGSAFAFQWSRDIAGIVQGGAYRLVLDLRDGEIPSEKAFTFVGNHDTERSHQNLTPADGIQWETAELLTMAAQYGTPVVYSGYAFSDRDAGAPQVDGKVSDPVCATSDEPADGEFLCISDRIAAMAKWRAQVGDAPIANDVWEAGVLSFDRGELGLAAFNSHSSEAKEITVKTGLPDATYCDVLGDSCDIEVADGKVTLTVPPESGAAIHVGALAED